MPEISRFFGIVIRMYFFDHDPPHFHARYGGNEVLIGIDPLERIDGDLPTRALALVFDWARMHQTELLENWHRLQSDEPPQRIPPLE